MSKINRLMTLALGARRLFTPNKVITEPLPLIIQPHKEGLIGHDDDLNTDEYWLYAGISVVLIVTAGFMSGMTMGLASIDKLDLILKRKIGSDEEKASAKIIDKVVHKHHWMLCTLLVMNAGCMEALPLFLDKILPVMTAIIVSVTAVLFFGEIIPQALCTGSN